MTPFDPPSPRDTAFWRAQFPRILDAALAWRRHPALDALWWNFVASVRLARAVIDDRELAEPCARRSWARCEAVLEAIQRESPETAQVLGGQLRLLLLGLADYELTGTLPKTVLEVIAHFPGNPITLTRDGGISGRDLQRASVRHLLQIKNYLDSLQPARRMGRPKKIPPVAQPSPRPGADAEAIRAYTMTRAGTSWEEIARQLWPTLPQTGDAKARNRVRARVNRRVCRGRLLAES